MVDRAIQHMQMELEELLHKQKEVLDSRMLGSASDTELLEYEIRQEIIHGLCQELTARISTTAKSDFRE